MEPILHLDARGHRISAAGLPALGPCLPRWWWRNCGETAWREGAPDEWRPTPDGAWHASCAPLSISLRLRQDARGDWRLAASIRNDADRPVELVRVHVLDGPVAGPMGFIAVNGVHGGNWLHDPFVADPAPLPAYLDTLRAMMRRDQWLLSWLDDPVHTAPGWAASTDCGVLARSWDAPGWILGTTGPGSAFGEAALHGDADGRRRFVLGQRLDGIRLPAGARRELDGHWLGAGDWQAGLERLAEAVAEEMPPRQHRPAVVGWCSWYRHGPLMQATVVDQAIAGFRGWDAEPDQRIIQLDDGWQAMPGDWRPNQRFAGTWAGLPQRIAESGAVPGIWVAPTLIHADHPLLAEDPSIIQRRADGSPAHHSPGWGWCGNEAAWTWGSGGKAHHLEPQHPRVVELMRRELTRLRDEGWRYFKLDFVWNVCTDRRAWDPQRTSFESIREAYRLCREVLGEDAIINACTGTPMRCAIGHADLCRIGDDLGADWRNAATCMRQMALRSATGGRWFQIDPDVFYMRSHASALDPEESRCITQAIAALGGAFITSEQPGEWNVDEAQVVRSLWPPEPVSGLRTIWSQAGQVKAMLSRRRDGGLDVRLFNWEDAESLVRVGPDEHPWLTAAVGSRLAGHGVHLVRQAAPMSGYTPGQGRPSR